MATLFDLELQESNNLIFSLMGEKGTTRMIEELRQCMQVEQLSLEEVRKAHEIFSAKPETLSILSDEDRNAVLAYWLKKKGIIDMMHKKGFSTEEIFQ